MDIDVHSKSGGGADAAAGSWAELAGRVADPPTPLVVVVVVLLLVVVVVVAVAVALVLVLVLLLLLLLLPSEPRQLLRHLLECVAGAQISAASPRGC